MPSKMLKKTKKIPINNKQSRSQQNKNRYKTRSKHFEEEYDNFD